MNNVMFFRKLRKVSMVLAIIITIQLMNNGFVSDASMNDDFYNGTHDEFIVTIDPDVVTININKNFSNRSKSDLISDGAIKFKNGRTICVIKVNGLKFTPDNRIEKVSDGKYKYIFDIKDVDYKVNFYLDSDDNLIYDAKKIFKDSEPLKKIEVQRQNNYKSYNLKL